MGQRGEEGQEGSSRKRKGSGLFRLAVRLEKEARGESSSRARARTVRTRRGGSASRREQNSAWIRSANFATTTGCEQLFALSDSRRTRNLSPIAYQARESPSRTV